MVVRCFRSSIAARRFFCSPSVLESSISSTITSEAQNPTNTDVSAQKTTIPNKPARRNNGSLPGRLSRLNKYDSEGAARIIAKWKEEGRVVSRHQFFSAVRGIKIRNNYPKALMICDSMFDIKDFELNPFDYALHLDLISRVRGLQSAEKYFDDIPKEMKVEITLSALLRIFVREGEFVKAEALMEILKKNDFLSTCHPYIHMMSLYSSKEQFDKAEEMFNEVKKHINPHYRIYNMWLNACAFGNDVEGAERAFAHMKEAKVDANWLTHATLAGMYIRNKLFEKAGAALKDLEDAVPPSIAICSSLINMHGSMGNIDEVMRIWDKLKSKTKKNDNEYGAMVRTLLKLDLVEEAEGVFKEWESFVNSSKSLRNIAFRNISVLMEKYRNGGKMPPKSIPEHTEEDEVELDLGLEESQQL